MATLNDEMKGHLTQNTIFDRPSTVRCVGLIEGLFVSFKSTILNLADIGHNTEVKLEYRDLNGATT